MNIFSQARCLDKVSATSIEKLEICALAVLVFFKNEISSLQITNSVNLAVESAVEVDKVSLMERL